MSRRKIAVLVGAVLVVLVAVIAITSVVVRGQDRAAAPASATPASAGVPTTSTPQAAASAVPRCGLQLASADQPLAGASNVRWQRANGAWWLAVSPQAGPSRRDPSGAWSCYSHDQGGAVVAAYDIAARVSGIAPDWETVTRQHTMPGVGQQAHISSGVGSSTPTTPRGFQVTGYTPQRATIRFYIHSAQVDVSCTMDVAWSEDDWKLILGDDGSTSSGCDQGAPEDPFTPWGP